MAAVTMKFLDGLTVAEMLERFESSQASVYRWLERGIHLLKGQLRHEGGNQDEEPGQ